MKKTPTTVVSGFLGSGKTTLILDLVTQLRAEGKQVVYIKNEIGDTDVDSQILQGNDIQTTELLNGCICCTLVGPFVNAITEVVTKYHPERIIIEASGAADPAALALMIDSHPLLERDSVLCVIDVTTFEGFSDLTTTTKNQTTFTDLIIFNKVELADLEQKKRVVGYVRELNEHAPILEATNATVPAAVVFGVDQSNLNELLDTYEKDKSHSHVETDQFQAFTYSSKKPISEERMIAFLREIPRNVFRAKGFWKNQQGTLYIFNSIAGRTTINPVPENFGEKPNTAVFIGYQAHKNEQQILKMFDELSE